MRPTNMRGRLALCRDLCGGCRAFVCCGPPRRDSVLDISGCWSSYLTVVGIARLPSDGPPQSETSCRRDGHQDGSSHATHGWNRIVRLESQIFRARHASRPVRLYPEPATTIM